MSKNVFGEDIEICSGDPLTGFFRTGNCDTNIEDVGMHTVCVQVTDDFLKFSISAGNDLSTPNPFYGFQGLKEGDKWCLCLSRWIEAYNAGSAPKIYLKATHISALEFIELEVLEQFAADSDF
jgi:hypothetical protein